MQKATPTSPLPVLATPRSHLVVVLVQFLFATFPVAGKIAFEGFDPLAVATWRVLFGATVLSLLALRLYPAAFLPRGDLPRAFLLALFGVAFNQVLFIEGLHRSTAVTAGFMMGVIPVATYGFALLLRHESWRLGRGLGLLTALAGAVLLILYGAPSGGAGADTLLGNLLLLGNSLSYSLYLVLARPLLQRVPSLVVTAWTFLLAAPLVALAAWGTPWVPAGLGLRPVAALGWILLFPTTLNYFLISWALVRLPASVIAVYIYLQPVAAMMLAMAVLGERVEAGQVAGGLLVMAGIWLVTRGRRRAQPTGSSPTARSR